MLNMSLLQGIEPYSSYATPDGAPVADRWKALQDNAAFAMLRQHGYRIITASAGYVHEEIRSSDEFINVEAADVVELHLLGRSAAGEVLRLLVPEFGDQQVRNRIESNLAGLVDAAREPDVGLRFALAHIPGPHPPFVYADSERPSLPYHEMFHYPVEAYGEQRLAETVRQNVDHLNDLILQTVEELVEVVGDGAVIVVMSDHGSRTHGLEGLSRADAAEQFPTLFAARTPDGSTPYEDDVQTADVLSTFFNHYLGTEFPPAPRVLESLDGVRFDPTTYDEL